MKLVTMDFASSIYNQIIISNNNEIWYKSELPSVKGKIASYKRNIIFIFQR